MIDTTSTADVPASHILHKAMNWDMTKVLVLGVNEDGEVYLGGSFSDDDEIRALLKAGADCLDALQSNCHNLQKYD